MIHHSALLAIVLGGSLAAHVGEAVQHHARYEAQKQVREALERREAARREALSACSQRRRVMIAQGVPRERLPFCVGPAAK